MLTVTSTFLIYGLETSSFPVVFPGPGRTERTPGGTTTEHQYLRTSTLSMNIPPAPAAISANSKIEIGASSDGFTITEFPAANAGAIFLIAMRSGWLKGYTKSRQIISSNYEGPSY